MTLQDEPTQELIVYLDHQSHVGVHTYCESDCGPGHWSRGGWCCADCLDAELMRRGVDVTQGGSRYTYERVDGKIRRKNKGEAQ